MKTVVPKLVLREMADRVNEHQKHVVPMEIAVLDQRCIAMAIIVLHSVARCRASDHRQARLQGERHSVAARRLHMVRSRVVIRRLMRSMGITMAS